VDIDTFGPVGLAGTQPSPPEMATREIVIPMQKVELDRLKDIEIFPEPTDTMLQVRAHITAWAKQQSGKIERPERPSWLPGRNPREALHWLFMLSLARMVGGELWAGHIEKAANVVFGTEQERPESQRLLIAIMKVFNDTSRPGGAIDTTTFGNGTRAPLEHQNRILSSTLADRLNKDGDWRRQNRGGPVDSRWLGQMLRGRLQPPGAQDYYVWSPGPKGRAVHHSVYYRAQFKKPWTEDFSGEAWKRAQRGILPGLANPTGETGETGEPVSPDDLNEQDLQWVKLDPVHSPASPASPDWMSASPVEPEVSPVGPRVSGRPEEPVSPASPVSPVNSGNPQEECPYEPDFFEGTLWGLRKANPTRSTKWLAAKLRQPEARVRRALGLPPRGDAARAAP
jgi:hypothetical protein